MKKTVSREKQLALVTANNKQKTLYVQDVRESVKGKFTLEDEVAMLRKMLYCVMTGNVTEEVAAEFTAYYNSVEGIKKDFKGEIGI